MDGFDIKTKFTSMLKKIGDSTNNINEVAAFAIQNSKYSNEIFDCILSALNQIATRDKLNYVQLIDEIVGTTEKFAIEDNPYQNMLYQNLESIALKVVPAKLSGTLNLHGFKNFLNSWLHHNIISENKKMQVELMLQKLHSNPENIEINLSKNDIWRRMNDDRERHKKLKENNWLLSKDPERRNEFEMMLKDSELKGRVKLENLYNKLTALHARYLNDRRSILSEGWDSSMENEPLDSEGSDNML